MIKTFTKKTILSSLVLLLTTVGYFACKKSNPKPTPVATPVTITSLSVTSGTYNTTVLISGTGFDGTAANDRVFFNGTTAIVTVAASTQLTVKVPPGATTGNITLSVDNATPVTGPVFTVIIPVSVGSLNVTSGPFNTVVVITGTGFDPSASNDKVFFNGKAATVSSATSTQLTVTVPPGAGTGPVTASVDNGAPVTGPIFTFQFTAVVTTVAGTGPFTPGSANGTGLSASFRGPSGLATDAAGNVYVADRYNNLIRKINPAGLVSTFAGSGSQGAANGSAASASFYGPASVAVDAAGNVYVADSQNHLIRRISVAGVVSTLAGSGQPGSANGIGATASFRYPSGVAVDASGNVYVGDRGNALVRKISPAGVVTTLAGNSNAPGAVNGTGAAASFNFPSGLAVDASGNVFVADDYLIRKITPSGLVTTFAGSGAQVSADGMGTSASFAGPDSIAIDANGNLYVTDTNLIRRITPAAIVTTIAGYPGNAPGSGNGNGTAASFYLPGGIVIDPLGNLYIGDTENNLIRKITFQ